MKKGHNWTKKDELVISYLYRFGEESLLFSIKKISELLGMSSDAIIMRISNYKAMNGEGTLDHFSNVAKEVNDVVKNISQSTHKEAVMKILTNVHNLQKLEN